MLDLAVARLVAAMAGVFEKSLQPIKDALSDMEGRIDAIETELTRVQPYASTVLYNPKPAPSSEALRPARNNASASQQSDRAAAAQSRGTNVGTGYTTSEYGAQQAPPPPRK